MNWSFAESPTVVAVALQNLLSSAAEALLVSGPTANAARTKAAGSALIILVRGFILGLTGFRCLKTILSLKREGMIRPSRDLALCALSHHIQFSFPGFGIIRWDVLPKPELPTPSCQASHGDHAVNQGRRSAPH